jgi:putative transcriptional regulator
MDAELFKGMMAGFEEAKKYRAGKKANVRVSRMAFEPVEFTPGQIQALRLKLGLSQPLFADFLGTSVGTIRSWEQGVRRPQVAAKRLLVIAKERPALLLKAMSA